MLSQSLYIFIVGIHLEEKRLNLIAGIIFSYSGVSILSLGYPVKVRDPKDLGGSPASFGKAIVVATPNSFEVEDKATTIPLPNKFECGTQAIADKQSNGF